MSESSGIPQRGLSATQRRLLTAAAESIAVDRGGGASVEKLLDVASLIVAEDLGDILEIGVYRGRFLLPLAALMQQLGRGRVVGIDPFDGAEALQPPGDLPEDQAPDLNDWVTAQDWEQIYAELLTALDRLGLHGHCTVHRASSAQAADLIDAGSVDLLHIDGNHAVNVVRQDLDLYLPKLRRPGYLVLDDVSWPGIAPMYAQISQSAALVFERHLDTDDYAIFRIDP